MKVLTADQLRKLDQYTIENEPITSIDLMERAAHQCTAWITQHLPVFSNVVIITGQGNNGGDGLVIARQLAAYGKTVTVYICAIGRPSSDFSINLDRLQSNNLVPFHTIESGEWPSIDKDTLIIDAIFGYGLNRPVGVPWDTFIIQMNRLKNTVVSIDLPSGLFADRPTLTTAVEADYTLTFETPKKSFFIPENNVFVGQWIVLHIGLDRDRLATLDAPWQTLDHPFVHSILRPRKKYDHKGTYGHAFLIAGSLGKVGAAILAARAVLRSGTGLLTVHVPKKVYDIVQVAVPEAMVQVDRHDEWFSGLGHAPEYSALGIGCGIGVSDSTTDGMRDLLHTADKPMVIDADGLNVIARTPELLDLVPQKSILTPHLKEFSRLFGTSSNHFDRLDLVMEMARKYELVIVLKGAHTAIALPSGRGYFNTTGNPGMATAGSGDVLTGIITGLLAQGYPPEESAILGVYLHGLAGDLGSADMGEEGLVAGDIVNRIGLAFKRLADL